MNPNFRLGLCLTGAALALIAFGAGHLGISLVFVFMTLMLVIDAAIEIICTAAVNNAFDSAEIEANQSSEGGNSDAKR